MKKYKDILYNIEPDPLGDKLVKVKIEINDLLTREASYKVLNIILHNSFKNVESIKIIEGYLDHEKETIKVAPVELALKLMDADKSMYMNDAIFNYVEKVLDDSYHELGKLCSAYDLARLYFFEHYKHVDYKKAVKHLKKGVKDGSLNAEELLGKLYLEGLGVKKNYKKAFKYLVKSSSISESPLSLYLLGDMYLKGYEVEKDILQANSLYLRAYESCSDNECDPLIKGEVLIRLANVFMGSNIEKTDYSNYLKALWCYQKAEIEFNKAMDLQHSSARNKIVVALKGQKKARKKIIFLRKMNDAICK